MGVIRKSLMFGTGGIVRGSSKKQRVAKAQLKELREQTRLAKVEYESKNPKPEVKGFWAHFWKAFLKE